MDRSRDGSNVGLSGLEQPGEKHDVLERLARAKAVFDGLE